MIFNSLNSDQKREIQKSFQSTVVVLELLSICNEIKGINTYNTDNKDHMVEQMGKVSRIQSQLDDVINRLAGYQY